MNFHNWLAEWSRWGWPLLANHLWQATLFAMLVWGATVLLKRGPARARHALWLIAATKFLLPSSLLLLIAEQYGLKISLLLPPAASATRSTEVIFQVAEQVTRPIPQWVSSAALTPTPASAHQEIYCALTVIWLLGIAAMFGVWMKRRWQFAQAVRGGRRLAHGREAEALRRVQLWLLVKREVALAVSPRITELGVWQLWRPIIVLPEGMAERLSDEELEAVMMHELIHVQSWDNLFGMLQMLLCCALWFHPLVWLIDRWLLSERELICDELVITCGGAPQIYAGSLWKVVQFGLGWPVAGVSRAASSNLRRRIEQMMIADKQTKLSLAHCALISAAALALVVLSFIPGLFTRNIVSAQSSQPRKEVTTVQSGVSSGVSSGVQTGIGSGVGSGVGVGVGGGIGSSVSGQDMGISSQIRTDGSPQTLIIRHGEDLRKMQEKLEQAPSLAIRFENADDAPLVITDARIKIAKNEENPLPLRSGIGSMEAYAFKLNAALTNNTYRKITGLGLQLQNTTENTKFSLYFERTGLSLAPGAAFAFSDLSTEIVTLKSPLDFPENSVVKVVGVQFEEPPHWGTLKTPIRTIISDGTSRQNITSVTSQVSRESSANFDYPNKVRVSLGALQGNAIKKTQPPYPIEAKADRISGAVQVRILVSEDGEVIAAEVISGHPLLRMAALEAARQWRFNPTTVDGAAVKVEGTLTFNFVLQ